MQGWVRTGEPELRYDGWRKVYRKRFTTNGGSERIVDTYDQDGSKGAAIIALTKNNEVVIARQFRCGPEKMFDEIPGGVVDHGETSKDAVLRELAEETGYTAGQVKYLGRIYKNGWMATSWDYYIAFDCALTEKGQQTDEFEEIEVNLISIDKLFDNARNAKMSDTEAVFLAYEILKDRGV